MDPYSIDDYFELALDLPERERQQLLEQLDDQEPQLASALRDLLARFVSNPDFACQKGVGGAEPRRPGAEETAAEDASDL